MRVAKRISALMKEFGWVTKPFTEGSNADAIDLSTSATSRKPPEKVHKAFLEAAQNAGKGSHRYMTNAGYMKARDAISRHLAKSAGIEIPAELIIMSYGASGGLNVTLKTLLDANNEVIVVAPHPLEYPIFVENHGGVTFTVGTNEDFSLNPGRIAAAIDFDTKAVLLSNPCDPTGIVYSRESLEELAKLLSERQEEFGKEIYLIWDRRYARIVHNGDEPANLFDIYNNSVLIGSFSKDLGMGGDRLGYIGINPKCHSKDNLFAGLSMVLRTMGFVNCPALTQHAVINIHHNAHEVPSYKEECAFLCDALLEMGYELQQPQGSYFALVKVPDGQEDFVEKLAAANLRVAPGKAFGAPGFFRVSYAVDHDTLKKAIEIFRKFAPKK